MIKKTLSAIGDSEIFKVSGGHYLIVINGTFGGTTATFKWRVNSDSDYITLHDNGSDKEVLVEYNEVAVIPGGDLVVNLSGGTGITLNVELHKISF